MSQNVVNWLMRLGLDICLVAGCCLLVTAGCANASRKPGFIQPSKPLTVVSAPNPVPVIHVVVALCDNKYQGIIPVPARIGNGDDLVDNLYWGADFGVKSYFRHRSGWTQVSSTKNLSPIILERVVFREKNGPAILVADAYRGREIKTATNDFVSFAAGASPSALDVQGKEISIGGGADMIIYVGHDGLMNFQLPKLVAPQDKRKRKVAVLCCVSQTYFGPAIRTAGADPILWTKSLMAPEAYVVEAAAQSFLKKESGAKATERASAAYAKFQHISLRAARTVFASGF
jgi:hypothetical protein